jgi:seryl-tRNA synthetase
MLTDEAKLASILKKAGVDASPKPFVPVVPPVMVRPEVLRKMARLEPVDDRFYLPKDDLFLAGSAEHTLGPLYMGATISESAFPLRYIGFSTSFRREAGSYGKDTRGIIRVHQFDKLEMESFTAPEQSFAEHDFFVAIQEHLMQEIKIPYRVVAVCTGDMGGPDTKQTDIEAWMPGQGKYRETHTADLMTDYQARRLGTKVRRPDGKTEFAHMNDATAFAIGRTIVSIFENYQTKEGAIRVPKVLQKYVGKEIIT